MTKHKGGNDTSDIRSKLHYETYQNKVTKSERQKQTSVINRLVATNHGKGRDRNAVHGMKTPTHSL